MSKLSTSADRSIRAARQARAALTRASRRAIMTAAVALGATLLMGSHAHAAPAVGQPAPLSEPFPFAPIDDALDAADGVDGIRVPTAAYVAGRCEVPDPAAEARLDEQLRGVLAALDPASLSAWAPAYVESAMALALRGHDDGIPAIRAVIADGRRTGDSDHLVAYYLAQAGDPSGWPAIVAKRCFFRSHSDSHGWRWARP